MSLEIPFADVLTDQGGAEAAYLPIHRGGQLRSLLPASSAMVLRRTLARSNAPEGRARHAAREGLAVTAAGRRLAGTTGLVGVPTTGLQQRLSELVGRPVGLALHFGPPRANRKPVVHAVDETGALLAVAKIGVGQLSERLVLAEIAVLGQLAGRMGPELLVPPPLGLVTWAGRPMAVQGAVRLPRRHRVPRPRERWAAEHRIAGLAAGDQTTADFADGLRDRLASLPPDVDADRYVEALDQVVTRCDLADWPTSPWHGDWSPQNLAATELGVAAWDWERFAPGRPVGFDTVHFQLQQLLSRTRTQAGVTLVDRAPLLLGDWQGRGRDHPGRARGVAILLLLELAARYLGDRQQDTESPGGRAAAWLDPALEQFGQRVSRSRGKQ